MERAPGGWCWSIGLEPIAAVSSQDPLQDLILEYMPEIIPSFLAHRSILVGVDFLFLDLLKSGDSKKCGNFVQSFSGAPDR